MPNRRAPTAWSNSQAELNGVLLTWCRGQASVVSSRHEPPSRAVLRGYLLEEALAWLLRNTGHRLLVHDSQDSLMSWS